MTSFLLELVGIVGLLIVAFGIFTVAWPPVAAGVFLFVATETIEWWHSRGRGGVK